MGNIVSSVNSEISILCTTTWPYSSGHGKRCYPGQTVTGVVGFYVPPGYEAIDLPNADYAYLGGSAGRWYHLTGRFEIFKK
jgi:hypothetical protein